MPLEPLFAAHRRTLRFVGRMRSPHSGAPGDRAGAHSRDQQRPGAGGRRWLHQLAESFSCMKGSIWVTSRLPTWPLWPPLKVVSTTLIPAV